MKYSKRKRSVSKIKCVKQKQGDTKIVQNQFGNTERENVSKIKCVKQKRGDTKIVQNQLEIQKEKERERRIMEKEF